MATKKRRSSPRPTAHGMAVVIEAIETQNRSTLDAIASLRNEMDRRFIELESRLVARIEALEVAVRQLAAQVQKNSEDIRKNSEDILLLKAQVDNLTSAVHGKVDARDFAALEGRVAALEDRVGLARG